MVSLRNDETCDERFLKKKLIVSDVVERFRRELASGEIQLKASSGYINQEYYKNELNVAITLIREALRELSATGSVVYLQDKGFRPLYDYSKLEDHEREEVIETIIEVARIRLDIEGRAIASAIRKPSQSLLLRASKILEDEEKLMAEQEKASGNVSPDVIMQYINYNNAFHVYLGHRYPRRVIHILHAAFSVFDPYQFRNLKRRQRTSHHEHREILECVKRQDPAAEGKLAQHIIDGAYAALQEIDSRVKKTDFDRLIRSSGRPFVSA